MLGGYMQLDGALTRLSLWEKCWCVQRCSLNKHKGEAMFFLPEYECCEFRGVLNPNILYNNSGPGGIGGLCMLEYRNFPFKLFDNWFVGQMFSLYYFSFFVFMLCNALCKVINNIMSGLLIMSHLLYIYHFFSFQPWYSTSWLHFLPNFLPNISDWI